jgi:signal transduction histidine kinase
VSPEALAQLYEKIRFAYLAQRAGKDGLACQTLMEVGDLVLRVDAELDGGEEDAPASRAEFLAVMSHELRTPINLVLGYAEMALEAGSLEESRADVARIQEAARHLLDLTNEVLSVGQIDLGWPDIHSGAIHLASFWEDAKKRCACLPRFPGVTLEWGEPQEDRVLVTDPHKLGVVLRNLIGNALKYTPNGHVSADLDCARDSACFTVSDTGIGIASEALGSIYDPFHRLIEGPMDRFGGLGFGLYIVRRFVEQLGGVIEVHSEPNVGSTFVVRMPWRYERTPSIGAEPRRRPPCNRGDRSPQAFRSFPGTPTRPPRRE